MDLDTPIGQIPRVTPQYQKRLERMGIETVRDILFHFPHRYDDFSRIVPISQADVGGPFCLEGRILEIKNLRTPRKKMVITQALMADNSGKIRAVWFNQPYLIKTFKKGDYVCLAGKITKKGGSKYLSNPAYERIPPFVFQNMAGPKKGLTHTGRLVPVYPETEGLSSKWLRFIIKPLLQKLRNKIADPLPDKLREENGLIPLAKALWQIHFPDSLKAAGEARKRFSFEELFLISLFVLRERMRLMKEKARAVPINIRAVKNFIGRLPFKLTDDQKKAAWQILKDMERERPMNRLLEGDVGSGKTIVTMIACLNAARAGRQAVFMAPTEILAKQHFQTFSQFLKGYRLGIGLMTGRESRFKNRKVSRRELLEKVRKGRVDILIGTQALIQNKERKRGRTAISFKNLSLVVIDEQHRFGVEQRATLSQQGDLIPHLLSMTATPIPRTLALTIYGDLDISLIREMPKGRKKIITRIVPPRKRNEAYDFIRKEIRKGRQAFVICPRIEPSAISASAGEEAEEDFKQLRWAEVKAVKEEYDKLSKDIFPDLRVGQLHGKMKSGEKEEIMKGFAKGEIDLLVSTSVVEVGIDVPNATVIMIEGAEKFGLAQLHQFRGRVGRAKFQSYCFLFTEIYSRTVVARLRAMVSSQNGFELAEKDLQIRGPGDFEGRRQWGVPDLAMASLKDISLVEKTREAAKKILEEDRELKKHPQLRERLKAFGQRIHLE